MKAECPEEETPVVLDELLHEGPPDKKQWKRIRQVRSSDPVCCRKNSFVVPVFFSR